MKNKLSRVSKKNILEFFLLQREELELAKKRRKQLENELENQKIDLPNKGSIVQEAAKISKIFIEAQKEADNYQSQ